MPAESATSDPPVALTQFLRGIGKRGYVLAEAQCGDIARAQQALVATIAGFRDAAPHIALAHWPEHFWQRLLAQPMLRTYAAANAEDSLAHLSAGPRAALLLRLVAGLDNTHAAIVLRVSPPAYRQALARALHALHEHDVDEVALRALRERLQQRVKALPEQFLQAQFLQAPAQRRPVAPRQPAPSRPHVVPRSPRSPPRWLRPALATALAVLVLVFVATFLRHTARAPNVIRIERLPEQAVATKLSPVASLLASPDFELLDAANAQSLDSSGNARDLALLSWFDAAAEPAPDAPQATPTPPALPESAIPETSAPDTEQTDGGQPGAL